MLEDLKGMPERRVTGRVPTTILLKRERRTVSRDWILWTRSVSATVRPMDLSCWRFSVMILLRGMSPGALLMTFLIAWRSSTGASYAISTTNLWTVEGVSDQEQEGEEARRPGEEEDWARLSSMAVALSFVRFS